MKKINIQNDLDSRAEIARCSSEYNVIRKESDVESLNIEEHAQKKEIQKCENHVLPQTGAIKKKTQRGRKTQRNTKEIPV